MLTIVKKCFNPKQHLTLALKWVLNPNQYNECLTLISIMSAQLLICKFAVFTCVSFFYWCLAWLAWLTGSQTHVLSHKKMLFSNIVVLFGCCNLWNSRQLSFRNQDWLCRKAKNNKLSQHYFVIVRRVESYQCCWYLIVESCCYAWAI